METRATARRRGSASVAAEGVGRVCVVCGVIVLLTAIALLPIFLPSRFVPEAFLTGTAATLFKIALPALPAGAVLFCFCLRSPVPINRRIGHFVFLIGLTLLLNDLHLRAVDHGPDAAYQRDVHEYALRLDPDGVPHSYRFLPNSIARWFEFLTGDYGYARFLYRSIFMFLVIFSIYYYASLFLPSGPALLAVAIYGLAYPVSIRLYAGQLTDPLSHLSFVLCFIFLARSQFWYFLLSVLIGALAKETVVALAFLYPLLAGAESKKAAKSVLVIAGSLAVAALARAAVVANSFDYSKISGVTLTHPLINLHNYFAWWWPQFGYTVGILLPFLALDWRQTPTHLRKLLVLLMPAIVASSLFFSNLHESRNYVPLVVPLGIVAARYLTNVPYVPPWRGDDEEWGSFVRRITPLVVWGGWAGMMVLALLCTRTFASNVQDLDHGAIAAAIEADRAPATFLPWGPPTELGSPPWRFVLGALCQRRVDGLLIAAYANVVILGLIALAMILAAKARRGYLSLFDIFFPLVLLNIGQSETFLIGTTLPNVATVALACMGLALVLPRDSARTPTHVVLGAGCVCLLTLCGIAGWALVPALVVWLGYSSVALWRRTDSTGKRSYILSAFLAIIFFVAASAYLASAGQTLPFKTPPAGWRSIARAALEFLGVSVGPAGRRLPMLEPTIPYVGLGILALIIASVGLLATRWRERSRERIRHLGPIAFSFAVVMLAAAIGWRLATDEMGAGYAPRLATLAAVVLCWVYLTWDVYGGALGRNVMLTALCTLVAVLFSTNAKQTMRYGQVFRGDVIENVPGLRRVSVPIQPASIKDITWEDGVAHCHGANPQLIFVLDRPLSVYAVRLTFAYVAVPAGTPSDYQAHFQIAWKCAGRNDFGARGQDLNMDLDLTVEQSPLTIVVNDVMDHLRIQPDMKDTRFQLQGVVLFVRD